MVDFQVVPFIFKSFVQASVSLCNLYVCTIKNVSETKMHCIRYMSKIKYGKRNQPEMSVFGENN